MLFMPRGPKTDLPLEHQPPVVEFTGVYHAILPAALEARRLQAAPAGNLRQRSCRWAPLPRARQRRWKAARWQQSAGPVVRAGGAPHARCRCLPLAVQLPPPLSATGEEHRET